VTVLAIFALEKNGEKCQTPTGVWCSALLWSHGIGFSTFTPEEVDQPGGFIQVGFIPKDLGYPMILLMVQKSGLNHQLRLVVNPIIYKVLAPSQVVQDFSHLQLLVPLIFLSKFVYFLNLIFGYFWGIPLLNHHFKVTSAYC